MSLNFDVLKQTEDFLEELVPEISSSREDWKPPKNLHGTLRSPICKTKIIFQTCAIVFHVNFPGFKTQRNSSGKWVRKPNAKMHDHDMTCRKTRELLSSSGILPVQPV